MARPEKEAAVAELTATLAESQSVLITDYRGLPVKALNDLRRQLRAAGAQYRVVKNTLMRRAAEAAGLGELAEAVVGPTAILFTAEDAAPAARALLAFARQHGIPQVRALMMGGKLYPPQSAEELSTLPSREVLVGVVMGAFQGPVAALVTTLQSVLGELAATLQALAARGESAPA